MKTMTLRNIPEELSRALEEEKRRRGQSLNQTAIDLMRQSLGLDGSHRRSNGLAKLAGGWTQEAAEGVITLVEDFQEINLALSSSMATFEGVQIC